MKIQDSFRQNKLIFWHIALQPLASFSHKVAYRSFGKLYKKNEFTTCGQKFTIDT
jgi:hypothetical protein